MGYTSFIASQMIVKDLQQVDDLNHIKYIHIFIVSRMYKGMGCEFFLGKQNSR